MENKLLDEIKYFTDLLYNQLGLTEADVNGTADEAAMNNYFFRTIDPILDAIAEAMRRAFLTKTARTQGHSVEWYRNPFKLVAMEQLAEIGKAVEKECTISKAIGGAVTISHELTSRSAAP